jgi:hypothetical protein
MIGTMMALLLAQAAPADGAAAMSPGERMLACAGQNFPGTDRVTLGRALVDEQARAPAVIDSVLRRMVEQCSDGKEDSRMPLLLAFGYHLMTAQRAVMADQAGVSEDRRAAFDAALLPVADQLPVNTDGAEFGPDVISDALLAQVRATLSSSGQAASMTDRRLRRYLELMARERTIRGNLLQLMAAR